MTLELAGGKDLVPVVADPTARPAVPAPTGQSHGIGMRRTEERFRRRCPPVNDQLPAGSVSQSESADVDRFRIILTHDVSQAQVEAEPPQGAQPRAEAVDLLVALHPLLTFAFTDGLPARDGQAPGKVGLLIVQPRGDVGEVSLVGGNQRRVRLGSQSVGKFEGAGAHWIRHRRHRRLGSTITDSHRACAPGAGSVNAVCRRQPRPSARSPRGSRGRCP